VLIRSRLARSLAALLCCQLSLFAAAAKDMPSIPAPTFGNQLLVSVSADWTSFQTTLYAFSRKDPGSPWQLEFSCPAVLGRAGLGWGLGLHGWILGEGPVKKEGDRRSPAGLFRLPFAFGSGTAAESGAVSVPYIQTGPNTVGVDDPLSPFYNRILEAVPAKPPQWKSAEIMLRPDRAYRLGVFVSHNDPAFPNDSGTSAQPPPTPGSQPLGSCIFLHIWKGPDHPTVGCTALPPGDMARVIHWLRAGEQPRLLQLPTVEYRRLQQAWALPVLPGKAGG